MALRTAILRHVRTPLRAAPKFQPLNASIRSMSSHGDRITKDEVVNRVLSVVKDFYKWDPSKVTPYVHFQKDLGLDSLESIQILIALEKEFNMQIPPKELFKIDDSCRLAIEYFYNHLVSSSKQN